jgi:hypothetical protein|tara:strand:+ start:275 stop:556 length:282 start_codon:yes stop_codon:yes gene_type:complete
MIIKELLEKSQLTEEEKNRLVGEVCAEYERLRFNGTVFQVMEIYDYNKVSDIKDGYLEEKTKKYYDGGAGFASALGTPYLTTLGGILRERSES